jgi:eukaryotic-like serine/threonine-protein kinase
VNFTTKRLMEIFHEAKGLPEGDPREGFLTSACAGDALLHARVACLLHADSKADRFLEVPACDGSGSVPTEEPGDLVGRYRLLEKIGEGGCGVVYLAEQQQPVRRQVALKIIKLGMDTRQVVARFEAERQALAMMDHPNIAKVFDGGATENGRPYFVMEAVRGSKITQFCDQNRLSTEQRLDLFVQVCQAIQHAHQKGIIHRDIKPSNILVSAEDGVPVPKVIDFGIAKATEQPLTDKTVFTAFEQFIGTPAYMSPEQAHLTTLDIDTRSDIYSLGVLLYELLTGNTPFDSQRLVAAGIDEIRRIIRDSEPPNPSTRLGAMRPGELTSVAARRHTDAPQLVYRIRGDLDWIVMKCLEKDRGRRYDTAIGLATDLNRHLENRPVLARPPSHSYRLQKLVRRNKLAVAATSAVAVSLIAGVLTSTWMYFRESDARERATKAEGLATERLTQVTAERDATEAARQEAEAVATFMTQVFENRDPSRAAGTTPLYEKVSTAAKKLEIDLVDNPRRRAKLQEALANAASALGLHGEAIPLREKLLSYHQGLSGQEHADTILALQTLAASYHGANRKEEARKLREQVLALRRATVGEQHPDTFSAMSDLAGSYLAADRGDEALEMQRKVLAFRRKVIGLEDPDTHTTMEILANWLFGMRRWDDALKLREEVVALRRKCLDPKHPDTISAMAVLADSYLQAGRLADAASLLTEVSTRFPENTTSALKLAAVQVWLGNEVGHATTSRRMLEWVANATKAEDAERVAKLSSLRLSDDIANRRAILALAERSVKMAQRNNSVLPWARVALGMAHYRSANYPAAEEALITAAKTAATTGPYRSHTEGTASIYRAMTLYKQGREGEARAVFQEAKTRMKPYPADEKNPLSDGRSDHEDLILWLAYKEAEALVPMAPALSQ